jgi:hypothetical protein
LAFIKQFFHDNNRFFSLPVGTVNFFAQAINKYFQNDTLVNHPLDKFSVNDQFLAGLWAELERMTPIWFVLGKN